MADRFGGVPVDENKDRFGGIAVDIATPPTEMVRRKPAERPGVLKRIGGSAENVLSMITGSFLEPAAGLTGIYEGVADYINGGSDPVGKAADAIEKVRSHNYQPKSQAGKEIQEMIAGPFKAYGEAAHNYGATVQDITGSPIAATVATSVAELAPSLLGVRGRKGAPSGFRERAADVQKTTGYAEDIGFDMGAKTYEQGQQLASAAERLTGDRATLAQDFDQIQNAVQSAKRMEKERVSRLYEDARNTKAGISVAPIKELNNSVVQSLSDFDIESMPIVQKRLAELSKVAGMPDNAIIKLNAIAQYRQRLNRNKPAIGDLSQQTALGIIKGQLDSFVDSQFNADMISGNPEAVMKWRMANGAYKDYAERFKANKVVKQLAEQQATPEEIRQWIIGTSAVGAKKGAGEVVARLKGILGEDSPQFTALRQDALMDIVNPLLQEEPNISQFVKNYDKFKRNNPTLAKELFPDSVTELDKLRAFAGAVEKDVRARISLDMDQSVSRILFGHGIAKAALKVTLANQIIKFMRSAAGKSEKTRIMGDILGYDPSASLIPVTPVAIEGIVQTEKRAGQ